VKGLQAARPCRRQAFAGCDAKVHFAAWIYVSLRRAVPWDCWRHCLEPMHLLPHAALLLPQ